MSIVATGRVLPAPSRAERKVTSASKGHCIGFAVLGRGAGVRMQAESHLELNHLYLLNADPAIADLREQVRFCYGPGACQPALKRDPLSASNRAPFAASFRGGLRDGRRRLGGVGPLDERRRDPWNLLL
jgi:hypothetical protein